MSSKTKMKDYMIKMFSTKESTSSTEVLLASRQSVAAPSSSHHHLLHALPIPQRSYQPTIVTVHKTTKYDKVPGGAGDSYRKQPSSWKNRVYRVLTYSDMEIHQDGHLKEKNLRQAYAETQDVDPKHPSIQGGEEEESSTNVSLMPQVLAALSVSLGSLVTGYASGYTSPTSEGMLNSTNPEITVTDLSLIGAMLPLAALLGGIAGGPLIDILGRKVTILATAIPFICSWLFIGLANSLPLILTGRAIAGFCIGMTSLALPVYLGETVQPDVRGTLGLLPTAFGNIGILLCYTVGMFINWWQLALFGVMVPVPFLILMFIIPETPTWYLSKGRKENAKTALQWLRGKDANIEQEFLEIEEAAAKNQKTETSLKSLFSSSNIKPVAITIGLMFFQQFSGVNAVIFYTSKIFVDTGSQLDESICTIIVGCVNFGSSFLATALIDRMGRKMLLYISSITMTVTLGGLGTYMYLKEIPEWVDLLQEYSFLPLLCLILYIVGFSLGFGPIPWLMMGELLPAKIRGPAASLATAFNWGCTSIVTLTFLDLQTQLGSGNTFWMFGVICCFAFFFVLFCVPETRGKSLEDIEKKFTKATRRMSSVANLRPSPMSM